MILQTIAGYRLPFIQHPPSQENEPSCHLSTLEKQICSQEITRLLKRGAIEIVEDCENQFLSSFFVIRKSSGGWRFILNLKKLNRFIFAPHFKLEDWKTVIRLLSPNDYLASIDSEDAYLLLSEFLKRIENFYVFGFKVNFFSLGSFHLG